MDQNQLTHQIKLLLGIAKISAEEKTSLEQKLPTATDVQLNALHDNLLQQVMIDIFFDELEALEKSNQLYDEDDIDLIEQKVVDKLETTLSTVFTEAELATIRQNLQTIQQKVATTTQPQSAPVAPQQAPVQTPPVPQPVVPPVQPAVPTPSTPPSV